MASQNSTLTDEQKAVLFDKDTEAPFSGKYVENHDSGMYACANCGKTLFSSDTKFDSDSGWPSFYDVTKSAGQRRSVKLVTDKSHGMERTEVVCSNCGGHLGHLFNDAHDQPTGQRYCINSCSIDFKAKK